MCSVRQCFVTISLILTLHVAAHGDQPFQQVAQVDEQSLINYFTIEGDTVSECFEWDVS
jgi:hypothetical protein